MLCTTTNAMKLLYLPCTGLFQARMIVLLSSSSSATTNGKRKQPVYRRSGPWPVTEQAVRQGYRPSPLPWAAMRTGDYGKMSLPGKTATGTRHSIGVDQASTVLIPTASNCKQQATLVVDLSQNVVNDPITYNAPVTERRKQ